jgi:hypothetical protein
VQGLGWKIHVLDPDTGSSAVLSRYFLLLSLGRTRIPKNKMAVVGLLLLGLKFFLFNYSCALLYSVY